MENKEEKNIYRYSDEICVCCGRLLTREEDTICWVCQQQLKDEKNN